MKEFMILSIHSSAFRNKLYSLPIRLLQTDNLSIAYLDLVYNTWIINFSSDRSSLVVLDVCCDLDHSFIGASCSLLV